MTTEEQQSVQTPGVVSDYFSVEGHLLSTRTGDAYKALDRQRQQPVCLWMLRTPFTPGSHHVGQFLSRMRQIDGIEPPVTPMTGYGVDAEGTGFAMLPALDGHSAGSGNLELSEAERRFIALSRTIDKLHCEGVACGDLSPSSFWIDRSGEVQFIGVLGQIGPTTDLRAVPQDLLGYIAPEERSGGQPTRYGDVYSLGMIAYHLLTRQIPSAKAGDTIEPVARFVNVPPVWCQEVIDKCTAQEPGERFENAGQILQAIVHIRQRSFDQEQIPVDQRAQSSSKSRVKQEQQQGGAVAVGPKMDIHREEYSDDLAERNIENPAAHDYEEAQGEGALKGKKKWVLLLIPLIIAGILILAIEQFISGEATTGVVVSDNLPGGSAGAISDQYSQQIQELQESEDIFAHGALVDLALKTSSYGARIRIEEAILERTRRLGFTRSSEQLKQWLSTVRSKESPKGYEPMLRTVNPALNVDERAGLLRQAYPAAPPTVLRMAAALSLDSGELEKFQPILAQLVGDNLQIENAEEFSSIGLLLAHEDLSIIFADAIVQNRDKLRDDEISKVLAFLAKRNDANTRAVANIGLERGILSPLRNTFLETIRDRKDLDPDVLGALTRAASGTIQQEDLEIFGRWYDVAAAPTLLAVVAEPHPREFQTEAFDLIAGKSPTQQPAAALLNWVRNNRWDQRGEFAQAIGIFAFLDVVDSDKVQKAFEAFDKDVKDSDLIFLLLDTNHPVVVSTVMEKYSGFIDLGTKLNLLKHPMKEVRLAAVNSIETNNVGALKIIVDSFEAEGDPEVKKAYQKFWMIRERTGGF